jgi:AraC-like DNA-binding protein
MVQPFIAVLRDYPQIPSALLDEAAAAPEGRRVPVPNAQALLQGAVELTQEPDLGLLAAGKTERGSLEALEYVVFSAPSWRVALEMVFRYSRLMNEAADYRLEVAGDKAQVVLHSTVPLARAGIDFQNAAFYLIGSRWLEPAAELEHHFTYEEPSDTSRHRAMFGGRRLVFGAPFNGFVFDAARLETPIASCDPGLHEVLRKHGDRLLTKLASPTGSMLESVRAKLIATLRDAPMSAAAIARELGISRRTLSRWLDQEGTTYSALLLDVRMRAAQHYVLSTRHSVDEIAFLTGFSEASAFARAYKRWTGRSPMADRKRQRSSIL